MRARALGPLPAALLWAATARAGDASHYERGIAAWDAGHLTVASKELQQEVAWRRLLALLDTGDRSRAMNALETFVAASPGSEFAPDALAVLGQMRFDQGDFEGAAGAFGRVPGDSPRRPFAEYGLAWCRYALGDHAGAGDALRRVAADPRADDQLRRVAAEEAAHIGSGGLAPSSPGPALPPG